jgi:hypothetical protein
VAERKYPKAKVGDRFGPYTVTAILPRGHKGRRDERVQWKCVCGRTGESWVFNLRNVKHECTHENAYGEPTRWGARLNKRTDRRW